MHWHKDKYFRHIKGDIKQYGGHKKIKGLMLRTQIPVGKVATCMCWENIYTKNMLYMHDLHLNCTLYVWFTLKNSLYMHDLLLKYALYAYFTLKICLICMICTWNMLYMQAVPLNMLYVHDLFLNMLYMHNLHLKYTLHAWLTLKYALYAWFTLKYILYMHDLFQNGKRIVSSVQTVHPAL